MAGVTDRTATPNRRRLPTEALVVGYAMSRLHDRLFDALGFASQSAAFRTFGQLLGVPASSIRLLKDEFDPIHPNSRQGWHLRKMNPSRVRIVDEFEGTSDEALVEFVRAILRRDEAMLRGALDCLAPAPGEAAAAAERLATGRRAEEWLMSHCDEVLGHPVSRLRDAREDLSGFDFELNVRPRVAIEVKGLRGLMGDLLFTDREWHEAHRRTTSYWLVVVGNVITRPQARIIRDPAASLDARCVWERSLRFAWRAHLARDVAIPRADRVAERRPSLSR